MAPRLSPFRADALLTSVEIARTGHASRESAMNLRNIVFDPFFVTSLFRKLAWIPPAGISEFGNLTAYRCLSLKLA